MTAPLALVGAQLGKEPPLEAASHSRRRSPKGMLCSERELGLVAGSRGNSRARRRCAARRRRGRYLAPRRYRARCRNHAESRRLPVDSRPCARGRRVVRRADCARPGCARRIRPDRPTARSLIAFDFDRRARSVPALRRARDDRNQNRPVAAWLDAPARTVRDARAQQRRRRDQLRDARARPAAARLRLRRKSPAARSLCAAPATTREFVTLDNVTRDARSGRPADRRCATSRSRSRA